MMLYGRHGHQKLLNLCAAIGRMAVLVLVPAPGCFPLYFGALWGSLDIGNDFEDYIWVPYASRRLLRYALWRP